MDWPLPSFFHPLLSFDRHHRAENDVLTLRLWVGRRAVALGVGVGERCVVSRVRVELKAIYRLGGKACAWLSS
jgi:hypothetical protein